MSSFSREQLDSIIISAYSASTLNLLGSLFTIVTFLLFKKARNDGTAMVFCLAISDFAQGIALQAFWTSMDEHKTLCTIQGAILMFGLCASVVWAFMIGLYLFLVLYKDMEFDTLRRLMICFHVIAWGYAIACSVAPALENEYGILFPGHELSWCWVANHKSKYRLLLYIPDTLIYALLVIQYCLLRFRLRGANNSAVEKICRKMSIFLLTYVLINTFAIINRMENYFGSKNVYVLFLLQFLTQPMQGFLNAFAYAWNEPMFLEQYRILIAKCQPRRQANATRKIDTESQRLISAMVYYDQEP